MNEEKYYTVIENYIKKNEISRKRKILQENYDTLNNYWNIGKLLVEAQGGKKRAKYGNELIKKWSIEFEKNYGSKYSYRELYKMRQFYLAFTNLPTVSADLSWSHIIEILPIKNENKRNFYINEVITYNLSVRELREKIKLNSYERLLNKPGKLDIITPKKEYSILEDIKNPILIKLKENQEINSEKDLEASIISQIAFVLTQFGKGFCFIDNQYMIKGHSIDILLFNYEINAFVVVELKFRELRKEDKSQTEFYMNLVDENLKKAHHNKTMGIIISKSQNNYIANFVKSNSLIPLIYKLQS